jgi:SAM-dependent methyltransferase
MVWRLASRAEYVGIEPDAASFAVARDRLSALRTARMIAGDIDDLPADERFDLVCAFEVLEHIEDDTAALVAWRDRIAKRGHVLLSVPAHQRRFGPADEAVGHYRRYDRADLDELLRSAGLEAVWVRGYGAGLGHALETTRNLVLRRSRPEDQNDATARSGRLLQPSPAVGRAVALGVTPFRALQRPWSQRGQGVGYVVLAVRVD